MGSRHRGLSTAQTTDSQTKTHKHVYIFTHHISHFLSHVCTHTNTKTHTPLTFPSDSHLYAEMLPSAGSECMFVSCFLDLFSHTDSSSNLSILLKMSGKKDLAQPSRTDYVSASQAMSATKITLSVKRREEK